MPADAARSLVFRNLPVLVHVRHHDQIRIVGVTIFDGDVWLDRAEGVRKIENLLQLEHLPAEDEDTMVDQCLIDGGTVFQREQFRRIGFDHFGQHIGTANLRTSIVIAQFLEKCRQVLRQ